MATLFVPTDGNEWAFYPYGAQPFRLKPFALTPRIGTPLSLENVNYTANAADNIDDILKFANRAMDVANDATKANKIDLFNRSFRRVTLRGLISLTPTKNVLGTLGGMVKDAKARVAFEDAKKIGKRLGWIGLGIDLTSQIWALRDRIEELSNAQMPISEKLGHIGAIAAAIASRMVAGAVVQVITTPATVGSLFEKYALGEDTSGVDAVTATIETTVTQVTDPSNFETQYAHIRYFITTNLHW